MALFKDLVIQYDEKPEEMRLAGIQDRWNRAMIISDIGLPNMIEKKRAAVLIPASVSDNELLALKKQSDKKEIDVITYINAALGVSEFYYRQDAIDQKDKELIVIDVYKHVTEICYLNNAGGTYLLKKTTRVDSGHEEIIEGLLEMPCYARLRNASNQLSDLITKDIMRRHTQKEKIFYQSPDGRTCHIILKREDILNCIQKFLISLMASIEGIIKREQAANAVILLAGRLWNCPEAVQTIKERYWKQKVISYRPEDAALLGGVYLLQKRNGAHTAYLFNDKYKNCYQNGIWGEVNRLNKMQKEGYWSILEALMEGRKEVWLKGNVDDLSAIYEALCIDYPEVFILWLYKDSRCYLGGTKNNPSLRLVISYQKSGRKLLAAIDHKADEILKNCVNPKCSYCDNAVIKTVYYYISEHYHYTKEKTSAGNYPDYAYTLETLIRCGVCHGYAISMIYLLRKLQIPILYVVGDADGIDFGGHAWNMIQIQNGSYRHLDVTWDLENATNNSVMTHYLLDDIAMKARRHFWKVQDYPACV